MSLEILLIFAFGGALLTYLLGKTSEKIGDFLAVIISLFLVVFVACLYGKSPETTFYSGFFGIPLILRLNMLSWFFAIAISGLGALCTIFSLSYMKGRERTDFFYLMLLVVSAAMLHYSDGEHLEAFANLEYDPWPTTADGTGEEGAVIQLRQ